jgi:membrane protease YdiL (CAAX protease family)
MEILFYIGGFLYMGYRISRYIITQKTKYIVTDNSMILWTFLLLIIPVISLVKGTPDAISTAVIIVASFFLFSLALYKEFTGVEYKDDYILAITLIIMAFEAILILELFGLKFLSGFKEYLPLLILSGIFGLLFYFFPDPFLILTTMPLTYLFIYIPLAAITEELIFRGVLLNLSERAFTLGRALIIQSIVFMLVHFIGLSNIYLYYSSVGLTFSLTVLQIGIYALLLFLFGIFSGMLYLKHHRNIIIPIVLHMIVNLIPLIIFRIII